MLSPRGLEETPSGLHCSIGKLLLHQARTVPEGFPSPLLEFLGLVKTDTDVYRIQWAGVMGQGTSPAGSISNWHQAGHFLGLGGLC